MATVITDEEQRKYPLKRPVGWKPKLPRWTLKLPDTLTELTVTYIGLQAHSEDVNGTEPVAAVEKWIEACAHTPEIVDRFEVISGRDQVGTRVWACYWTNVANAEESKISLDVESIYAGLDARSQAQIGLWTESFTPDLTRFETNYSGDDYRPGLAQLEGTEQVSHELTGYWGAARDRMYASAFDDFSGSGPASSSSDSGIPSSNDGTKVMHSRGTNTRTIAHIRSGQFWENCTEVEREAYENDLEPHLRNGLNDIQKRPHDLGDYGLRFLRNLPLVGNNSKDSPRCETCAAGFFRSLSDLEAWAKDCPSHHKIYGGSMHHRNRFGMEAKMRTWHEICVLKPGEASWEYLNCLPDTGTLLFQASTLL